MQSPSANLVLLFLVLLKVRMVDLKTLNIKNSVAGTSPHLQSLVFYINMLKATSQTCLLTVLELINRCVCVTLV